MKKPSLLPDDYKEKEDRIKKQVAKNTKSFNFHMHIPGENGGNGLDEKSDSQNGENGIVFGKEKVEVEKSKKGKFIYKKDVSKRTLRHGKRRYQQEVVTKPFKHDPVKPVPKVEKLVVKPKLKKEPVKHIPEIKKPILDKKKDETMRMRIPDSQIDNEQYRKKIVTERADEFEELTHPNSVFDASKKDALVHLKNPPAEMNLIHEDYKNVLSAQFYLRIKMFLLIVFVFLILFSIGFVFLNTHKVNLVKEYNAIAEKVDETDSQISDLNTQQMQTKLIKNRLIKISETLETHLYWTKLFDYLEHHTLQDVYYTDFVAEDGKSLTLLARAPTYTDLAGQLLMFESADFVEFVDISGGNLVSQQAETVIESGESQSVTESEVEFTINLRLKDNALFYEE